MPKPQEANASSKPTELCFTIMPFGGWHDNYYQDVFKPAIEEAGLIPRRADDILRPGTIVNDIWQYTQQAKIILADLSGKNPNVLYELGLAHALARPSILVTQSLDDVPFDLRSLRVIEYDKNVPNWGQVLKAQITGAIREIALAPLKSILPAFLEVDRSTPHPAVSPHDKEMLEIRQELNLMRGQLARLSGSPETAIGPREAEELARQMLDAGLSRSTIARRLTDLGVPRSWTARLLDRAAPSRPSHEDEIGWLKSLAADETPDWFKNG